MKLGGPVANARGKQQLTVLDKTQLVKLPVVKIKRCGHVISAAVWVSRESLTYNHHLGWS
jgi:hypothetical protein